MPLGNGRQAVNVWLEPCGDLCFYLASGDAWGEFGQLYKVGRVRVRVTGENGEAVFGSDLIAWSLDLLTASIRVESARATLRIWVDAHHPCVHIRCQAKQGTGSLRATARIERWRTRKRVIGDTGEQHMLSPGVSYEVFHGPDEFCHAGDEAIGWYHHNESSSWRSNLAQQGLLEWAEETGQEDPLLHRTFGAIVHGRQWKKCDASSLETKTGAGEIGLTVSQLTLSPSTPEQWTARALDLASQCPEALDESAWEKHCEWWRGFWSRSWIHIDGSEAARKVSSGYALQRFLNACAGRGEFPIKFNGSLFTADWHLPGEDFDVDYRRWGPGYWHQNTRLPYWSMLATGDWEHMRAYFDLYLRTLPVATERCRRFLGHPGAFHIESMTFWGTYMEGKAYGLASEREEGLSPHLPLDRFCRLHNSSGLEVVYHGILFYRYTRDDSFVRDTLLPLAIAAVDYYDHGFGRKDGRLHIYPAQSLEQWWEAEDPLPEIAALRATLTGLLSLPAGCVPEDRAVQWRRLLSELPSIPEGEVNGKKCFLPAHRWEGPPRNVENPELYVVFPYHLAHHSNEHCETGRNTFFARAHQHDIGWAQDGMQAALLGLAMEARASITKRLCVSSNYARFPAFWGPNFDWLPDQDQGGSAAHALQLMLLQCHEETLHALPAWPAGWSVDARLHALGGQVVEIQYKAGGEPRVHCAKPAACLRVHVPQPDQETASMGMNRRYVN